jgi:hypothetical protein
MGVRVVIRLSVPIVIVGNGLGWGGMIVAFVLVVLLARVPM